MMKTTVAFLFAFLISSSVSAQCSRVIQNGNVANNSASVWVSPCVIGQAAPSTGANLVSGLTPIKDLGVMGNFGITDNLITGAYHSALFGWSATTPGEFDLNFNSFGGAAVPQVYFVINGVRTLFPPSAAGISFPLVTNVTALRATSTATASEVYRQGFSTAGDGGQMMYHAIGSACPGTLGDDGGSQVASADSKCWIWDPDQEFSVNVFGGNVTSLTDAQPTLAKAWAAEQVYGGRMVLPPGVITLQETWTVNPTVNQSFRMRGQGYAHPCTTGTTTLVFTNTSGDGLVVVGAGYGSGIDLTDLTIAGSSACGTSTMAANSFLTKMSGIYHGNIQRVSVYHYANGSLFLGPIQTLRIEDFIDEYQDVSGANTGSRADIGSAAAPSGVSGLFYGTDANNIQGINGDHVTFLSGTPSGGSAPQAWNLIVDGAFCSSNFSALYVGYGNGALQTKQDAGLSASTQNPCYTYITGNSTTESDNIASIAFEFDNGNEWHISGAEISGGRQGLSVQKNVVGPIYVDNTIVRANAGAGVRFDGQGGGFFNNVNVEGNGSRENSSNTTHITNVTSSGGLVEITYNNLGWSGSAPSPTTGDRVTISGVVCTLGDGCNANNSGTAGGTAIVVIDGSHFTLNGSSFPGGDSYTSGGTLNMNSASLELGGDTVNFISTGGVYGQNAETTLNDYGIYIYNGCTRCNIEGFISYGTSVGQWLNNSSTAVVWDQSGNQLLLGSTVAGLSSFPCNSTTKGNFRYVTDASSPTYNGSLTGLSTTIVPVFCNGTNWLSH